MESAKGDEELHKGEDRADQGVAGAAVANFLAAHAVLLTGEGERGEHGSSEVGERAPQGVNSPCADPQGNVTDAKKAIECIVGFANVLAGTEEEEDAKGKKAGFNQGNRR